MNDTNAMILTVLLVLSCVLVVLITVVCIKLIGTTNRVNRILDDVEGKLQSVNGVFSVVDNVSAAISSFGNKITTGTLSFIDKIFNKGKEE